MLDLHFEVPEDANVLHIWATLNGVNCKTK